MASTSPDSGLGQKAKRVASRFATGLNVVIVLGAVLVLGSLTVPYMKAVMERKPAVLPSAMVSVDWKSPESSQYCLACHKQVGPATEGLAVERGHSQNVPLNAQQLDAVHGLGAVAGPDGTLICMSCHQLDQAVSKRYMLVGSLEDSRLCQQCHPGHYARGTAHDLRTSAPTATNRLGQTVAEGGPCSACHLSHSFAREFTPSPLDPEGYCVSCHSTASVAGEHARGTMDHPDARCRDCHDPHEDAHGDFLRKPVSDLCVECHKGYADGPAAGMHPLGPMEDRIPQSLIDAGAHLRGDDHNLTCVVCHDTHEVKHEALLHLTPRANELCLACHRDKLLARGHGEVLPLHGQQPKMNADQLAVVADWGNPVGPEGELLCISCHRVHGSEPDTALLTFAPKYGDTCVACHPAAESVFGTSHDLRIDHPDLPNRDGLTPIAAGACSACHMSHGFPRELAATAADPGGQCISCHRTGDCGSAAEHDLPHPETACIECHDPHTRAFPKFLRQETTALCSSCHEEQSGLTGGPHDVRVEPEHWPSGIPRASGTCLPCHVAHGGENARLLRAGGAGANTADQACLGCHAEADWAAQSDIAAIHPQRVAPEHHGEAVKLVPVDDAGNRRMGCTTCHNPHGAAQPQHLARVERGQTSEELCLHCHTEKRLIRNSGHAADRLKDTGYPVESCKPCHAMHAAPDGAWGQALSPRFLMERCDVGMEGFETGCVPCLGCHHPGGPAPVREVASHPSMLTVNPLQPGDLGYMPLFGPDGKIDPRGQVTCRTCHLSHGREDLLRRLAEGVTPSAAEASQLKAQVRPFEPPNLCSSCHGPSARALFLYFHDKARRGTVEPLRSTP